MNTKRTVMSIAVSAAAAAVNILLSALKIFVGLMSGSVSVMSDGFNNLVDVFTSAASAVTFAVIARPSNPDKPHGYGRTEYLVSFFISLTMLVVGVRFLWSSVERFIYPRPVEFSWMFFGFIAASVPVKAAMAYGYKRCNRTLKSPCFDALYWDSIQDCCITLFTLLTFWVASFVAFPVDAAAGIIIFVGIIVNSVRLIAKNFYALLGAPMPPEVSAAINAAFAPLVESGLCINSELFHDYGVGNRFVTLSVTAPAELTDEILHTVDSLNDKGLIAYIKFERGKNYENKKTA